MDDDLNTRKFLETLLSSEYHLLSFSCEKDDPILLANEHHPSLILLDSFVLCKKLKTTPSTKAIPVIVISSRNKPSDVAEGLTIGADDFLTKPFDHKELQLRIRTHLKSAKAAQEIQFVKAGKLEINTVERTAKYAGSLMSLTITEYDILRLLASRVGTVVSREEIMKVIWKDEATETTDRTIDVHIRSLRKKIPELAEHIRSVYGVGYQYWE